MSIFLIMKEERTRLFLLIRHKLRRTHLSLNQKFIHVIIITLLMRLRGLKWLARYSLRISCGEFCVINLDYIVLFTKHSCDQVKACSTHGRNEKYIHFNTKTEARRQLGRPRQRRDDYVKMSLKETRVRM